MWSVSALCETLNPDKTKLFHQNPLEVQKFSHFESLMNCTQKPVVHDSMLRKIQNARHDSATYEKLRWEGRRYFSNNCTQTSKAFRSRFRRSRSPRFELQWSVHLPVLDDYCTKLHFESHICLSIFERILGIRRDVNSQNSLHKPLTNYKFTFIQNAHREYATLSNRSRTKICSALQGRGCHP